MQLRAATTRGSDELAAQVERAVEELDGTIRDVRGTIFELQHEGSGTVRDELRALVREYADVLGFAPSVRTAGAIDTAVGDVLRDQLLAVAREALSNVARHSEATRVDLEVTTDNTQVVLVVADNGVGLTGSPDRTGGHGLRNARHRARVWGGELALERLEPHGLTLRWWVPLLPRGTG